MGNGCPPGEGREDAQEIKWLSHHPYTDSQQETSLRDRVSPCPDQKHPPPLAISHSSGSFKIEFPTERLWIPRNVSPAVSTQVSEPCLVDVKPLEERRGGAPVPPPRLAQAGRLVLSLQARQPQLVPHGPPDGGWHNPTLGRETFTIFSFSSQTCGHHIFSYCFL